MASLFLCTRRASFKRTDFVTTPAPRADSKSSVLGVADLGTGTLPIRRAPDKRRYYWMYPLTSRITWAVPLAWLHRIETAPAELKGTTALLPRV